MFELLLSPVQAASGFLCIASIRELTGQKRLTEQVWRAAVFQERARMARDVHDTLAQGFACVLLHLEAVDELAACLPEEVWSHLRRARELARQHLREARRSIWRLSNPLQDSADLVNTIRKLANCHRLSSGTHIAFSARGNPFPLPPAVAENLLRIAQQAVDNALQHACAGAIHIALGFDENLVCLRIQADGRAFDNTKAGLGFGLTSMRQRATEIGGKFELISRPGNGARIEVRVPLQATAAASAGQPGTPTEFSKILLKVW